MMPLVLEYGRDRGLMDVFVAVDIGGTKVRVEVFPQDGWDFREPLASKVFDTPTDGEIPQIVSELAGNIREVVGDDDIISVGAACPGPLDPKRGIVLNPANLHSWWGMEFSELLGAELGSPVALENDANLGGLGEFVFGGGEEYDSTLYVTISTGIGGGFVVDGEIFGGHRGFAVEIGHVTITDKPYPCGCGRTGCVESATSGTSIARRAKERGWQPPEVGLRGARAVIDAADEGDVVAREIVEEAATYFGKALVDFIYCYDPEIILLGGGVAQSDLYLGIALDTVEKEAVIPAFRGVPIERAVLGERCVVLGAFELARRTAPKL